MEKMDAQYVTDKSCALIRKLHGTNLGAKEFSGGFMPERVDAILYNSSGSFLIETKISRSDFLADAKKQFRASPEEGIGKYRYYACPEGLIKPEEVPERWGLIYVYPSNKRARMVKGYGGWIKIGQEKDPVYGWNRDVGEFHGCPYIKDADYKDPRQPHRFYAFDERCMNLEWRYLFALTSRLATGKFPKNIITENSQ